MALDPKIAVNLNLTVQILLTLLLVAAIYMAKKKKFNKHCNLVRLAMIFQILAILVVMFPAMSIYREADLLGPLFRVEILVHHGLGLGAIILWAYANLVYLRFSKALPTTIWAMRFTAGLWMASLLMGLHVYYLLYLLGSPM